MYSTGKPSPLHSRIPTLNRIPTVLVLLTVAMATVAAIPTALIGGADAVAMMGTGAVLGLLVVLGGYGCAQLAFRGPDRYAVKLVVGGFLIRVVLLGLSLAALVRVTRLEPSRFVLWLVAFYFVLVMAEAWILARRGGEPSVRSSR